MSENAAVSTVQQDIAERMKHLPTEKKERFLAERMRPFLLNCDGFSDEAVVRYYCNVYSLSSLKEIDKLLWEQERKRVSCLPIRFDIAPSIPSTAELEEHDKHRIFRRDRKRERRLTGEYIARSKSRDRAGCVYVLINSGLPGVVKIGRSIKPARERAKEINAGTGVIIPWTVFHESQADDCVTSEKMVHRSLQKVRVNRRKEGFRIEAEVAAEIVKLTCELQREASRSPRNNYRIKNIEALLMDNLSVWKLDKTW